MNKTFFLVAAIFALQINVISKDIITIERVGTSYDLRTISQIEVVGKLDKMVHAENFVLIDHSGAGTYIFALGLIKAFVQELVNYRKKSHLTSTSCLAEVRTLPIPKELKDKVLEINNLLKYTNFANPLKFALERSTIESFLNELYVWNNQSFLIKDAKKSCLCLEKKCLHNIELKIRNKGMLESIGFVNLKSIGLLSNLENLTKIEYSSETPFSLSSSLKGFLVKFDKIFKDKNNNLTEDCPVCLEKIKNVYKTSCNHTFCSGCLKDWLKKDKSCPMCRKDLSNEKILKTSSQEAVLDNCSICLDKPLDPYFLNCGHSFCKSCIEEWVKQSRNPTCPNCRHPIKEIVNLCLICSGTVKHSFTTDCNHTFCRNCLYDWCQHNNQCPKCTATLGTNTPWFRL